MRVRICLALFGVVAVTAACTEPRAAAEVPDTAAGEHEHVSRRDSAGIEIVTTNGPTWTESEPWRLAAAPSLSVSGSALGIQRVGGVTRLAGGDIAVADAARGVVLVLDDSGAVTRTLDSVAGRPFRQLFWIGAAGDTLLAYDIADHRLVSAAPGDAARAVSLRPISRSSFTPLRPLGRFAGGGLAVASGGTTFPFPGKEYEVRQDSAVLMRYAPSGRPRDTLGIVPWGESFGVTTGSGRRRMVVPLPRPYGRATSVAVAGDRLYFGTGERFEISVLDSTGMLLRLVRIPVLPDSLPAEAVDSYEARVRRRVEAGDSALADLALAEALQRVPYPETVPAYERVLVAPEGVMWVLDAAPLTRETVIWRVFAADGRWLGVVPMPARLLVHEIGNDYVLGVWTGDDGDEEVRLYRIERPLRSGA